MSEISRFNPARIREHREQVIAALQEHFARDDLDVDEFERRVTLAHTTESPAEMDTLIKDLEPLPDAQTLVPTPAALVPLSDVRPLQTIRGFMSATTRTGPWSVPRTVRIKATMSSTVLDFREARFPQGPVDIQIRAFMSSVEIMVPPGLAVETDGSAIMGTFDDISRAPTNPDPDAPLLRIHGMAFMSAVEVKMRLPGESERQHHHRQRLESRQERQSQRALDRPR
jgi:hypothetical protein